MVKHMSQLRLVDTPDGPITYTLTRKRVKRLILSVEYGGAVFLSVPLSCSLGLADDFVREKRGWLQKASERRKARQRPPLPPVSREECARLLKGALDRVYPLVQPLGVSYPLLKLRPLKTQWGNCHWTQGYITLNTALARCPEELRDYVALHELVHFLHHDHGPGFYACMDALMPDWQRRRTELKGYGGALEHHGEGSEQT